MTIKKGLLGSAIKTARKNKGLTQERLAEDVDITTAHLVQLERERRTPSLKVLFKLAQRLNFSVDTILFPENTNGQEMRHKIEHLLKQCNPRDLAVVHATLEALIANPEIES